MILGTRTTFTPVLIACVLLSGACAGGTDSDTSRTSAPPTTSTSTTPSGTPTPPALVAPNDRCPGSSLPATVRPTLIPRADSYVYGLEAGSGTRTIVLVHGSGSRGVCVWTNEIGWLASAGFRVLAVDLPCVGVSTCPAGPERPLAALGELAAYLKKTEPNAKVGVIAASAGGPVALHLASRADSGFAAAVALSPAGIESNLQENGTDLSTLDAATKVRIPTLVATAPDDGTVDQGAVAEVKTGAPAELMRVELLPAGSGHAQEVLYDSTRAGAASPFRAAMTAFLTQHLGS